jgi:hypothetical protein
MTNKLILGKRMNPDKEDLYRITWRQDYPEFQEAIDAYMDMLLESSCYVEANEVIAKIKSNLN